MKVTKLFFFTNMKDKLSKLNKSNVIYQFSCRGCESSYIGNTEQTFLQITKEHVTHAYSAIKRHLDNYSNVKHLFPFTIWYWLTQEITLNLVLHNTRIIYEITGTFYCLKKHIKVKCPISNNGVKASREMQLWWMQILYTNSIIYIQIMF